MTKPQIADYNIHNPEIETAKESHHASHLPSISPFHIPYHFSYSIKEFEFKMLFHYYIHMDKKLNKREFFTRVLLFKTYYRKKSIKDACIRYRYWTSKKKII